MYLLKCEHSFDSAHFLKNYAGKCSNIHGHRWRVSAEIFAEKLISDGHLRGMIVDFGELKEDLKSMVDAFDHAMIIEKDTMRPLTLSCLLEDGYAVIEVAFRPTAENFSEFFFGKLQEKGYDVKRVEVYETPSNCASYEAV